MYTFPKEPFPSTLIKVKSLIVTAASLAGNDTDDELSPNRSSSSCSFTDVNGGVLSGSENNAVNFTLTNSIGILKVGSPS